MTNHQLPPATSTSRILDEGVVLVVRAASDMGISISAKTAIRWCLSGVRGVALESIKVRGRRMTSRQAMRRFIEATQAARTNPAAALTLTHEGAKRCLAAFGLDFEATE